MLLYIILLNIGYKNCALCITECIFLLLFKIKVKFAFSLFVKYFGLSNKLKTPYKNIYKNLW